MMTGKARDASSERRDSQGSEKTEAQPLGQEEVQAIKEARSLRDSEVSGRLQSLKMLPPHRKNRFPIDGPSAASSTSSSHLVERMSFTDEATLDVAKH